MHTLPELVISLADQALAGRQALGVIAVRVEQSLSLPTMCEIACAGPLDDEIVGRALPGARLEVAVRGVDPPLFVGEVTAVEHSYDTSGENRLRVRGYDALHRLRKRRRLHAHRDCSVSSLASDLASVVGLDTEVHHNGPGWPYLLQAGQSDLDFLVELAGRAGLYLAVREGTLHVLDLSGLGDPLALRLGNELLAADLEINADPACREVRASGWEISDVAPHAKSADGPRSGRKIDSQAAPGDVGSDGVHFLVDSPAPTADCISGQAQAELDRRIAGEVVVRGVAEGDPRLRPGAIIDVSGVARQVAGHYVLTSVSHRIDAERGYVCELASGAPALSSRRAQSASAATLGVVSAVDTKTGRVRAKLPGFGDLETDWMQIVMASAGSRKGLVALPQKGDRVLVILCDGDPARGVVAGGLYGKDGPPGQSHRPLALHTSSGHIIELDDDAKMIRVKNGRGSYLELDGSSVRLSARGGLRVSAGGDLRISASDDLTLEASGKMTIAASRIDFQKK